MPEKVRIVKAMVFPVVIFRCESWTREKAESQRTDAFEFWCWRRLLRVPGTARRSNQSNLKEINLEYSLEGLMLMLKLQNFGHLMQRADSLEKILMLRNIQGKRRRGWQRLRWSDRITDLMDMNLSKVWETVKYRGSWGAPVHPKGNQSWIFTGRTYAEAEVPILWPPEEKDRKSTRLNSSHLA